MKLAKLAKLAELASLALRPDRTAGSREGPVYRTAHAPAEGDRTVHAPAEGGTGAVTDANKLSQSS